MLLWLHIVATKNRVYSVLYMYRASALQSLSSKVGHDMQEK